jgi:hypothetical protein
MTLEEHQLLILMLARIYQATDALSEILKSREIISQDDLKAFQYTAWADNAQILKAVAQARADYLRIAEQAGVRVPQKSSCFFYPLGLLRRRAHCFAFLRVHLKNSFHAEHYAQLRQIPDMFER